MPSQLPVKSTITNEPLMNQLQNRAAMTEALASRSVQEVQAALVVAKKFPRDEFSAIEKIKVACRRRELAEMAEYEYSRGGTKIIGPTIDLLKAIAKRWGNLEYGWQELERRDGESSVRAYAWDMESNARVEMIFVVRHWRDTRDGGYKVTEERDIYELTANFAARRVRACLESVVDSDVVQAAVDECRKTLKGGGKVPLIDQARQMVSAFAELGVTVGMIETRLGNKLEAISDNQLAGLRRVFKSIKDGVGVREDFFKSESIVKDVETADSEDEGEIPMGEEAPKTPPDEPVVHKAETPAQHKESPAEAQEGSPQAELGALVVKAGFTFDQFVKWGTETGNIDNADSMTGYHDLPAKVATRLLRAKTGLLRGLAAVKNGDSPL